MKTIKRQRKKIKSKSKHKLQRKRRTHRRRKILRGGAYTYDDLEDATLWTEFTAISRDDMEYLYELFFLYRNDKGILEKAYKMVKQYRTKGYKYDGRIIVYTEGEGFTDFDKEKGFVSDRAKYPVVARSHLEEEAKKLSDKELVEITFKHLKIKEKMKEKYHNQPIQPTSPPTLEQLKVEVTSCKKENKRLMARVQELEGKRRTKRRYKY